MKHFYKVSKRQRSLYTIAFITLLFSFYSSILFAADKGKIVGKLVDSETGEALIGANVYLENTTLGAATDLDGNYVILQVPIGTYVLVVSNIGYAETKITEVKVETEKLTKLNLAIQPVIITSETITIEAKALKNTEASLLKDRQKSAAVSDAISSESMSRAGSDNAADALKQITGASIAGDKYVYVRGMGDRYTSTQLNGAEIPSIDPYKRAGAIDIIPSELLDNIVTVKSFTPDKPGNFSGGIVDIRTKDFPDALTVSAAVGSSWNPQVNLKNDGAILYEGGSKDWLGMDDGTRGIPNGYPTLDESNAFPAGSQDYSVSEEHTNAYKLNYYAHSLSKVLRPSPWTFPLNKNLSLSVGNQISVFENPFGFFASISYSQDYSNYENGNSGSFRLGGHVDSVQALLVNYDLNDHLSSENVLWGGLFKSTYKITPLHEISFNVLYNQNGESMARSLDGKFPYESGDASYQTTVLSYKERTMSSFQLMGDHQLSSFLWNTRLDWAFSWGKTAENDPDIRYFTNSYDIERNLYNMKLGHVPSRYYRELDEDRQEANVNLVIPFSISGRQNNFKFGGLWADKSRNYQQRKFIYNALSSYNYNGNIDDFLSNESLGIIDTLYYTFRGEDRVRYDPGLYIQEPKDWVAKYTGEEDIQAYYGMLDLFISDRMRFIGGIRYETTTMNVVNDTLNIQEDSDKINVNIDEKDLLPSFNLVYAFGNNMNVRFAYGRTLARPTFREVVPYKSFEFFNGLEYKGNPSLNRTLINNIDLRWEWFTRPNEIFAFSTFYKRIKNPIEQKMFTKVENLITWENVDHATVYGLEAEARLGLDRLSDKLANFLIGGNLSLIESIVDIPADELRFIRNEDPYRKSTRQLAGQSPYIINTNLTYDNPELGLVSTLYYNVFGERLSIITQGGAPDVFEQPFHQLNFSISWKFISFLTAKFSAKNLLDSEIKQTQTFKGVEYNYTSYNTGRTFGIQLKYDL